MFTPTSVSVLPSLWDGVAIPTGWQSHRTNAWLQNYRRVLVRHERLLVTYRAFVVLACAMIALGALSK